MAFSYQTRLNDDANILNGAGNYTFAGVSIGTAHANRLVVLGVLEAAFSTNVVTVGGVTATQIVKLSRTAIYAAVVPTGTTATVDVDVTGANMVNCCIAVWVGYPASSTPLDFGSDSSNTTNPSVVSDLDIVAGGFALGVAEAINNDIRLALTWNGTDTPTEHFDSLAEATGYAAYSIATTETNSGRDWSVNTASSNNKRIVCASWGAEAADAVGRGLINSTKLEKARLVA